MNTLPRLSRTVRGVALALAVAIAPAALVTSAAPASATVCEADWGSLKKQRDAHSSKKITDVRSGRHLCFDRLVIDLNGRGKGRPGYQVRYVNEVHMDGSGARVPLRGGAKLMVIVNAPAYNARGQLTYQPANRRELVDVSGYRTFRQVAWAGTFEGQTTIGLGVRAKLPMRVSVLNDADGGHRVVIDVAHLWY